MFPFCAFLCFISSIFLSSAVSNNIPFLSYLLGCLLSLPFPSCFIFFPSASFFLFHFLFHPACFVFFTCNFPFLDSFALLSLLSLLSSPLVTFPLFSPLSPSSLFLSFPVPFSFSLWFCFLFFFQFPFSLLCSLPLYPFLHSHSFFLCSVCFVPSPFPFPSFLYPISFSSSAALATSCILIKFQQLYVL